MNTQTGYPATIRIVVDADALSAFIPALAKKLQGKTQAEVTVEIIGPGNDGSAALETLLSLEKMVVRRGKSCWSDRITANTLQPLRPADSSAGAELIIDLTAHGAESPGSTSLRPLYNGHGGETGLAGALFYDGTPDIVLLRTDATGSTDIVGEAVASLEAAAGIGGAMEAVWSRVVMLLFTTLEGLRGPALRSYVETAGRVTALSSGAVRKRSAKMIATAAARAAYHLCCHAPHWRIGWRRTNARTDVWARRDMGGERWTILADPIDHFYADPFPFHHQGKDYIFFEDLDHKTGKGIISVVAFGEDGKPGDAIPVLEEPWHLSYPFLIHAHGELWMIPEASLSGEISIYRCAEFPHRWERHGALLSGLEAADATIVSHGDMLHMFAVVRDGVGGYSDALAIWHANDLFGAWKPHAGNPVLIHDRTARPAGDFVVRDGKLMRPVQDCRNGYGAALALARIDRLDEEHFDQTIETELAPGGAWPGRKLHTLNGNGRIEVVDGSIIRPRLGFLKDLVERRYTP